MNRHSPRLSGHLQQVFGQRAERSRPRVQPGELPLHLGKLLRGEPVRGPCPNPRDPPVPQVVAPLGPVNELDEFVEVVLHLQADADPAAKGGDGPEGLRISRRGMGSAPGGERHEAAGLPPRNRQGGRVRLPGRHLVDPRREIDGLSLVALAGHLDEPSEHRGRPGRILEGGPGEFQGPEIHPVARVDRAGRPHHPVERGLVSSRQRAIFEVVEDERPRVQHLDGVDDRGRSIAPPTGKLIGPLEQGRPEPLPADAGIEVGGKLERLRPTVPRAGGLVRAAGETERIDDHVSPGPEAGRKDLAKRSGARPLGGRPMTIRAASEIVKRWA